jgi:hypothetical protein
MMTKLVWILDTHWVSNNELGGFPMRIYTTKDAYTVIGFDEAIEPRPEPIILAGETIRPGDEITAILGKNSSAGFGSFDMKRGFITYAGKYTVTEGEGDDVMVADYALFDYNFPRDLFNSVNGHKVAYVCWILGEVEGETMLFYQNECLSSRVIWPRAIKRHLTPREPRQGESAVKAGELQPALFTV